MYEQYWNLKEKPFENTPDPRFLYHSQRHEEAVSRMLYVIKERKGAGLLTGEYGSGKTLLSRVLMEELDNDRYQSAVIFNPRLSALQLLKEIIYQLGGSPQSLHTKPEALRHFNELLYRNKKKGKDTIIFIDEAQAIPEKNSFEEVRLLLNFQLNTDFLLNIVLIGQPELRRKIERLPQLKQRMAVRYHLTALSREETKSYIQHRMEVAGAGRRIFLEPALDEIYVVSDGIPRRINNICDMALLTGFGEELDIINRAAIKDVADDLEEAMVCVA